MVIEEKGGGKEEGSSGVGLQQGYQYDEGLDDEEGVVGRVTRPHDVRLQS